VKGMLLYAAKVVDHTDPLGIEEMGPGAVLCVSSACGEWVRILCHNARRRHTNLEPHINSRTVAVDDPGPLREGSPDRMTASASVPRHDV
jgi:hypothetical protein